MQAFGRRLNPESRSPLVVALSGGSDSLALLRLAAAWAAGACRPVIAVTVDHALQPQSAAWTVAAAAEARALGAEARSLVWTGDKPTSGLSAAARAARHRLLAQAAHDAGASVILLGHTADDRMETALMQATGSTLGGLTEWSPSPVWPIGRGLFHFRPLLALRRADLRRDLTAAGIGWIDDPANIDPRYARARARAALATGAVAEPSTDSSPTAETAALASTCKRLDWGGVSLCRAPLTAAPADAATRVLAAAIASVSGRERLPRRDRITALLARLGRDDAFTASVSGARVEAADDILVMREPGEGARGGLSALALPMDDTTVWDGRYAIAADRPGLTVRALGGVMSRLSSGDRQRLKAVAPAGRAALPAIVDADGALSCPVLADGSGVRIRPIWAERFAAACGLIAREA